MRQPDMFRIPKSWNAGRIIGPKAPLKPKHIWAVRQQPKASGGQRHLAMFNSPARSLASSRAPRDEHALSPSYFPSTE